MLTSAGDLSVRLPRAATRSWRRHRAFRKRILGSRELPHPLGFLDWITGEDEQIDVEARFCGAGATEAEAGVAGELWSSSAFRPKARGSTALTITAAGLHDRAASAMLVIGVSVPR